MRTTPTEPQPDSPHSSRRPAWGPGAASAPEPPTQRNPNRQSRFGPGDLPGVWGRREPQNHEPYRTPNRPYGPPNLKPPDAPPHYETTESQSECSDCARNRARHRPR
ncbi:hypothetical protein GCM10010470_25480 [Saccharopolyspora taberi]|uniref:Uncharacterized protein n=1 Tax=Saccharopolyspora taberi TaxID=60895 RepID=A0ABN3VCE5_9PSEU